MSTGKNIETLLENQVAPKSNSGEQFLKEFPTGDPWSFTFDPKSGNIVLADVVSLKEFRSDLRKLEAKLSFLEKTLGKP